MASKPSKSNQKSKQATLKPPAKGRARSTKTAAKTPSKSKRAVKPRRSSPPSSERGSLSKLARRSVFSGLSVDRKLDILGVILALIGLLTLLSLLSTSRSTLTGTWLSFVGKIFGLGGYFLPFGLVAAGLWLVLRNFERIPSLAVERLFGAFLLFTNLLTVVHFISFLQTSIDVFALAEAGLGGGYVGASLLSMLMVALGRGGAAVALAAWLLIALALTLDLSILELFSWLSPVWARVRCGLTLAGEVLNPWLGRKPEAAPFDFTPIPPELAGEMPAEPAAEEAHAVHLSEPKPEALPWVLPSVEEILDAGSEQHYDDELDRQRAGIIEETLSSFGAPARVVEINRGPTITQFGVEPDFVESRGGRMRVRVSKITSLADDLALALSARTIRIQAPVPGKGFIGIEVPNEEVAMVALRDLVESEAFRRLRSPLRFALGQNVSGMAVAADLAAMPHLLVAGATGSGKSVCVNAIISCLLLNNTPDELRLIMVDPKRVELTGYNGIPHLLAPVVVEMERVVTTLQWVTREMDMRYRKLAEAGSRNIKDYNAKMAAQGKPKLPYLVVIIDELADLMMLAPDETERTLARLAQLARATGIHLIIATQRPSVDVVTGLIKANFPARVAFAVASGVDSRVILDQPGAERLLGRGDMLFQAPDAPAPVRLQGVFVSDNETQRLVQYWRGFMGVESANPVAVGGIVDDLPSNLPLKQLPMWEEITNDEVDPLLNEAIDLVRRQGRASISMLQRRMRIGYTRAARLVEAMEEKGIVGPPDAGAGTREVLDYGPAAPPADEA